MKTTKVTFQTTYNIGPFLNIKVGFEAEPQGNPGDSPMDMLTELKEIADDWYKKEYPHMQEDSTRLAVIEHGYMQDVKYQPPSSTLTTTYSGPSVINLQDQQTDTISAIQNAHSIEKLAELKLLAGTKPEWMKAYMEKLKELTNG